MRDARIDSIKGFLICTVVVGHMIEQYIEQSAALKALYLGIYSFHMPLFVLVSGYVFNPGSSTAKLRKGILRLMETFLVFDTLRMFIAYAGNGYCNFDPRSLIIPQWTLWFLPALCVWRLMFWYAHRHFGNGLTHTKAMAGALVLALVAGLVPLDLGFSFQRIFCFFPFFIAGNWLKTVKGTNASYNKLKIRCLWGGYA